MAMQLDVRHAVVLRRNEGEEVSARPDRSVLVKLDLEEIGMTETSSGARERGAALHIHKRHADSFYVVEGEPQFRVGDDTIRGEPGLFVAAPPGVVHSFSNHAGAPARVVNVHAPSCSFDEYLRAMDEAANGLDDVTHTRYDVYEVE